MIGHNHVEYLRSKRCEPIDTAISIVLRGIRAEILVRMNIKDQIIVSFDRRQWRKRHGVCRVG